MWSNVWTYFLSFYTFIYNAIVPCSFPEQLLANTIDHQQYLGKWFCKAAVSHNEAEIQMYRLMDNLWFNMEKTANGSLLLSGHMRIGDNCVNQTWTYHIYPDRDDLALEGKPKRRSLLWSGTWANCPECIILQEIEPPLSPADSVDSLNRFLLYARQIDVDSDVVTTFLKKAACNNLVKSVTLPQEKGLAGAVDMLDEKQPTQHKMCYFTQRAAMLFGLFVHLTCLNQSQIPQVEGTRRMPSLGEYPPTIIQPNLGNSCDTTEQKCQIT